VREKEEQASHGVERSGIALKRPVAIGWAKRAEGGTPAGTFSPQVHYKLVRGGLRVKRNDQENSSVESCWKDGQKKETPKPRGKVRAGDTSKPIAYVKIIRKQKRGKGTKS